MILLLSNHKGCNEMWCDDKRKKLERDLNLCLYACVCAFLSFYSPRGEPKLEYTFIRLKGHFCFFFCSWPHHNLMWWACMILFLPPPLSLFSLPPSFPLSLFLSLSLSLSLSLAFSLSSPLLSIHPSLPPPFSHKQVKFVFLHARVCTQLYVRNYTKLITFAPPNSWRHVVWSGYYGDHMCSVYGSSVANLDHDNFQYSIFFFCFICVSLSRSLGSNNMYLN